MTESKKILIKGGTAVTGQSVSQKDILIENEQIAAIGDLKDQKADEVIDAKGFLILPGAVDSHVHFNDEFMGTVSVHDYYTGTLAAAYGGVTSVIDFSNQAPGTSLLDTIKQKKREAEGLALVDWGVHPVITEPNVKTLEEISGIVEQGAPTVKCYMTYRSEGLMMEEPDLIRILARLQEAGGMLMVHAEDNDIIEENVPKMIEAGLTSSIYHARSRPPEAENRAIESCIRVARETGGRIFIVHMATADGIKLVEAARKEELAVYAETCTHYLIFTDKMLERPDGIKWICSPPLRDEHIQNRLWEAVADGRIALVTSDDAAFSWEAKQYGAQRFDKCPNGIPGIEPRLNLLYSEGVVKGRLSLERLVQITSTIPAVFFGLAPRKGSLIPGADADIIIFDPQRKWVMGKDTLHMAADWSAYEGMEVRGKISKVFSRGELIINEDECLARKGRGRYLHRILPR